MKPNSDSGWWIVVILMAFFEKKEGSGREPELISRMSVSTRCEHWREAYLKARRIGLENEREEKIKIGPYKDREASGKWHYAGIFSLTPFPKEPIDTAIIGEVQLTPSHNKTVFGLCPEDYSIESCFEEDRIKEGWSRPLKDSDKAGF
jgi:hypothetical protein